MTAVELYSVVAAENLTLAVSDGKTVHKSSERGVRPLVALIKSGADLTGFVAADRIVGRAAAFLYAILGVKEVYAGAASVGAAEVCKRFGIALGYDVLAERIINRKGDGVCPMEQAVSGIDEPRAAFDAVCAAMDRLSGK